MQGVIFAIGYLVGGLCAAVLISMKPQKIGEIQITLEREGIDPDELVAWIENQSENYEYLSPPTAGEITQKIREMQKAECERRQRL